MGDSLSAAHGIAREKGWVALLRQRLERQSYPWRVVNASASGETSRGGLARLPRALNKHDPEVVIIELGGNDGLRGLPISQLRANLRQMIEKAEANGADVLLTGIRLPKNYGPRYTKKFRAVYGELAAAHDVGLVPFFMQGVALQPELMQSDGIHPNAAAQPKLLDNVWPHLKPLLQK